MLNQRSIIILSAVLLAVIVVSVMIYFLFPASTPDKNMEEASVPSSFDLNVTKRSGYLRLDTRPIQDGSLPVAPPAATGKANPFL